MVERTPPKVSGKDPVCPVCRKPIRASDKVRGRSDELIHESCDNDTQRPAAPRRPGDAGPTSSRGAGR